MAAEPGERGIQRGCSQEGAGHGFRSFRGGGGDVTSVCAGSARASQETAIAGSFQQAFLSIQNSVGVW